MTPIPPTDTHSGPAVPVVATSRGRLIRKIAAAAVAALGQVVPILQAQAPTLLTLFPHVPWLGNAITGLGLVWMMFEKARDAVNLSAVNFSGPPTVPLPPGVPMPEAPVTPPTDNV